MRGAILIAWLAMLGVTGSVSANESPKFLTGLVNHSLPRFPIGLRGVTAGDGEAVLVFTVGVSGKIMDCVALEATRAEFADAAIAAVMSWQFEPTVAGTPTPRREVVEFAFRRNGVVTTLQHAEAAHQQFNLTTQHAEIRTVKLAELDRPPERLAAPMPKLDRTQLSLQGRTPLLVNFVIDAGGQVRVPVVTVVDPTLAPSVLDAVKQWRYAPPTQNGMPVLVEMTRSLVLPGAASEAH